MFLYHGSYCEVAVPNLSKCAAYKDFGKGFYLTTSKKQAEKFIGTALKKARSQGIISEEQEYGVVSTYCFKPIEDLNLLAFADADTEWLHCVVAVSYTHLDVYKRQEPGRPSGRRIPWRRSAPGSPAPAVSDRCLPPSAWSCASRG